MLLEKYETPLKKQGTKVQIEWRDGRDTMEAWNEICAWTIEQFGLPGTRFKWRATQEYMNFYFDHEEDAIHFILRWA